MHGILIYTSHTNSDYYTKELNYKHYINGSSKIGAASIVVTQIYILGGGGFGCHQVGHLNRDFPTTARRRSRTEDGKIICFGCNEVGHIRPFCPKYQQQGRAPSQWQENMGNQLRGLVGSGGSQQEGTLPILKIDVKRMVTQEVLCGDKRVSAAETSNDSLAEESSRSN